MLDSSFFVGWGTLSLINAGLAQGKGRSGLAWCLISLLLGPIATFLIVLLNRVEHDPLNALCRLDETTKRSFSIRATGVDQDAKLTFRFIAVEAFF